MSQTRTYDGSYQKGIEKRIQQSLRTGGFSTNINKFIIDNKYNIDRTNLGLPEEFIPHGNSDEIYDSIGLSPIKIAEKIKSL